MPQLRFSRLFSAFSFAALAAVSLTGVGCVSQDQADQQLELLREKDAIITDLQARLEDIQNQLSASTNAQRRAADLEAERDRLIGLLEEANATITTLKNRPPVTVRIKPEVASALAKLAGENPELMRYDAKRGMIQLQSDLTFPSGSIEVNENAVAALNQLATVLKETAKDYDVRIVGHTDNVKVRALANRRFRNNWELSIFRSLAVKDVLTDSGVKDARIEAAGRGQFVPVVANTTKGAQANRRVEIFLTEPAATPGSLTPGTTTP